MRIPQPPASHVPDWALQAIFYHIYPLGFLGAPAHNERSAGVVPRLEGLRRWYDHLAGLGVTAIYSGPLFESHSHGYDTIDYFQIDRRLGDLALFRQIVDELHRRGIRIILDGVFNHTGRGFFAFEDILRHGRDSRYQSWYHLNWGADSHFHDGFGYESWEGYQGLPRLNHASQDVRSYLFEVARMWLGDVGVDGWRLDVAHELPPEFWWEFRQVCKAANPDCFLVGEVIHGDYRTWAAPDLLDGVTNYQLYKAVWSAFNEANLHELKAAVERASHPEWGLYRDIALLNFLGNHDVTRILSQLKEPSHVYPALIFLLTAPGIPCLYYGDEAGLRGSKEDGDGALRPPMPAPDAPWPDTERSLYRVIARLAALRRAYPSLASGGYHTLETTATTYSYLRRHAREQVLVTLNTGPEPVPAALYVAQEGIPDGTRFVDLLDEDGAVFTVQGGYLPVEPVYASWGRVLIGQI
jgi:glycosidase